MKIAIINGPNLNLQGERETDIYGVQSFDLLVEQLKQKFKDVTFHYFQSNIEGELVDEIQAKGMEMDGIVLNPAAYSHTSVAIGDAIAAISAPVIEVHISNIYAREEFRKLSYVSSKAKGLITGMGMDGYELAVQWFILRSS